MIDAIERFVYRRLSGDPNEESGWSCVPPGAECWFTFGPMDDGKPMFTATTYNNDGFELWIAYTHGGWLAHFRQEDARKLAKLILWDWWVVATWCGLKRRIWYWSLRRNVKRTKAQVEER
jgi:hypothetical protein